MGLIIKGVFNMDDVLLELDSVFKIISSIPVTGDSVDNMSAARAKLRRIYAKLSTISSSAEEQGTPNNSVEV